MKVSYESQISSITLSSIKPGECFKLLKGKEVLLKTNTGGFVRLSDGMYFTVDEINSDAYVVPLEVEAVAKEI